jgi:hypothetical protein
MYDCSVDFCLLHLLRGVVLHLLAFPEPHVVAAQGQPHPTWSSVEAAEWARQARAVRYQSGLYSIYWPDDDRNDSHSKVSLNTLKRSRTIIILCA